MKKLLEEYYRLTREVNELGIPEKIKRGQKLTFFEELKWQNWRNMHATVKFLRNVQKTVNRLCGGE